MFRAVGSRVGNKNETVLKLAAGHRSCRYMARTFGSTPVVLLQDDHDYFDNDEAWDEIVTVSAGCGSSCARTGDSAALLPGILARFQ